MAQSKETVEVSKLELEELMKELSSRRGKDLLKKADPIPTEDPMAVVDKLLETPKYENHKYLKYINNFWSTTNVPIDTMELFIQKEKLTMSIISDLEDMGDSDNSTQEHTLDLVESMVRRSGGFEFFKMFFTRISKVHQEVKDNSGIAGAIRQE
jgi:hypothetical protein